MGLKNQSSLRQKIFFGVDLHKEREAKARSRQLKRVSAIVLRLELEHIARGRTGGMSEREPAVPAQVGNIQVNGLGVEASG